MGTLCLCSRLLEPAREHAMPDFVFTANIAHYKEMLATETDARKIAMLRKLLAEEEAKLAAWHTQNPRPKAAE